MLLTTMEHDDVVEDVESEDERAERTLKKLWLEELGEVTTVRPSVLP